MALSGGGSNRPGDNAPQLAMARPPDVGLRLVDSGHRCFKNRVEGVGLPQLRRALPPKSRLSLSRGANPSQVEPSRIRQLLDWPIQLLVSDSAVPLKLCDLPLDDFEPYLQPPLIVQMLTRLVGLSRCSSALLDPLSNGEVVHREAERQERGVDHLLARVADNESWLGADAFA